MVIIDGVFGDLNMLNAISPADIENFTPAILPLIAANGLTTTPAFIALRPLGGEKFCGSVE